MKPLKRWSIGLAIIVIIVGSAEIACRSVGLGDPPVYIESKDFEYMYAPNQRIRRFGKLILVNEYSMRSLPLSSDDSLRILLLGDSVIHGGVQTDHTALASTLLEDSLSARFHKKIRVLNISAGGWAPDNVAAYIRKFGDFNAKIMVLDVNSADATDYMTFKKVVDVDPHYPGHKPLLGIMEGLQRYVIPTTTLFLTSHFHKPQVHPVQSPQKEIAPIRLNSGFSNLYEYTLQHGISFVIVLHPNIAEISKAAYNPGGQEILRFAKEKNIPLISELDNKPSMNLYRDVIHINDAGQRFLFNELYPLLIKKVGVVVCGFKTD